MNWLKQTALKCKVTSQSACNTISPACADEDVRTVQSLSAEDYGFRQSLSMYMYMIL